MKTANQNRLDPWELTVIREETERRDVIYREARHRADNARHLAAHPAMSWGQRLRLKILAWVCERTASHAYKKLWDIRMAHISYLTGSR